MTAHFQRRHILLLLVGVLLSNLATAQVAPSWQRLLQLGGPGNDQLGQLLTDAVGNVYQVGTFAQTIQCGTTTLSVGPMATFDMYLVKSDPQGNVLWARQAGSMANSSSYGFAEAWELLLDNSGNLYIAGDFSGGVTFGSAATTLTAPTSKSSVFLAKFTSQGAAVWVRQAPTTNDGYGTGLALAANGDIFLSGSYYNAINFGTTTLTSQNNSIDAFVARYSAAGTLQWAATAGGPATDFGQRLLPAPGDGVYLAGEFEGTIAAGTVTASGYGNSDCFLAQYSAQGVPQAVQAWGGSGNDYVRALCPAPNGEFYVAGAFTDFALFGGLGLLGQGGTDGYLLRCSAQGAPVWARQLGGSGNDYATAVVAHSGGPVYVGGRFTGTATVAGQSLTSTGGTDAFVARYEATGLDGWAVRGGSSLNDYVGGIGYAPGGLVEVGVQFMGAVQYGGLSAASRGQTDVARCQLRDNTPLSLRPSLAGNRLTVSPNPTDGATIQIGGLPSSAKVSGCQLLDMAGQVIFTQPAITIQVSSILEIKLLDVPAGNYLLEVMTNTGPLTTKVMIIK